MHTGLVIHGTGASPVLLLFNKWTTWVLFYEQLSLGPETFPSNMGVYRLPGVVCDIEPALPYKIPYPLPFLPDLLPPEPGRRPSCLPARLSSSGARGGGFPFGDPTGVELLTWLVYVGG